MSEAMVGHARKVLDRMIYHADGDTFTGKVTELFTEAGVPSAYYSRVMRILGDSRAVEQVRRGGGPTLSIWKILDPEIDLTEMKHLAQPRHSSLEERVKSLETRVGSVSVPKALVDLQGENEYNKRRLQEHLREDHGRPEPDVG